MNRLSTIVASVILLSGCGAGGTFGTMDEATFFADPATFAMYDCTQLQTARAGATARVAELKALMLKAETGPGGAVVAEVAYRSDYLRAEGRLKSINQHWERNRCDQPAEQRAGRAASGSGPMR